MKNTNETEKLPKGIRLKNGAYQWNRQINGVRVYGTAPTLKQAIKDRASATAQPQPTQPQPHVTVTLGHAINEIMANAEVAYSANTYKAAVSAYKEIQQHISPDTPLDCITTRDADRLIRAMTEKGHKIGTINARLVYLSKLFTVAREYDWIKTKGPTIHWLHGQKGRIRYFTAEEENRILAALQNPYDDIVKTLIDTGLRRMELLSLRVENVNIQERRIAVWKTKNKTPRVVPMTDAVLDIMKRSIEGKGTHDLIFNMTAKQLAYRWNLMRRELGYEDDPAFVLHVCRHTCATRMIKKGVPIVLIQKWLGHNDISTTMRYAHLDDEDLFKVLDVIN